MNTYMNFPDELSIKIVMIGDNGVGKTSLRRSYLGEHFRENYIPTIGSDFSFKKLLINNQTIKFLIWDLAGEVKFQDVHPLYYKGSFGAVLVYDITRRDTFTRLDNWISRYLDHTKNQKVPILIAGNKVDLIQDGVTEYVTEEEQEQFIKEMTVKYKDKVTLLSFRTSAKTGQNVTKAFIKLANVIHDWISEQIEKEQQKHPGG